MRSRISKIALQLIDGYLEWNTSRISTSKIIPIVNKLVDDLCYPNLKITLIYTCIFFFIIKLYIYTILN